MIYPVLVDVVPVGGRIVDAKVQGPHRSVIMYWPTMSVMATKSPSLRLRRVASVTRTGKGSPRHSERSLPCADRVRSGHRSRSRSSSLPSVRREGSTPVLELLVVTGAGRGDAHPSNLVHGAPSTGDRATDWPLSISSTTICYTVRHVKKISDANLCETPSRASWGSCTSPQVATRK
jgi:hypothetical protein